MVPLLVGAQRERPSAAALPSPAVRWLLLLLLLLVLLLTAVGCNAIKLHGQSLERGFARQGLDRHVETVGDATVHYYDGGPREPIGTVLLVHGFGAETVWQWGPQVQALVGAGYRVLVPNLLWFGRSTSTHRDFSVDHQLRTVTALMDHVGVDRVDAVVGISYGGLLAFGLAAELPERVGGLVILDSPGPVYTDADYAGLLSRFGVEHPGPLLVPDHHDGIRALVELAYYKPPATPAWLRKQILATLYQSDREEKVALLESMVADMHALRARDWRVSAPTLLLWGDEDPVFPLEIGQRLSDWMGDGARLEVIARARHAPQLEHPRAVNALLLDFLATNRPDGPLPSR